MSLYYEVVGNCGWCRTGLVVDRVKVAALDVFCPNESCAQFAASYWIDRKTGMEL